MKNIAWKVVRYLLGVVIGTVVSLTIAQQKFPPNPQMLVELYNMPAKLKQAQEEMQKAQAAVNAANAQIQQEMAENGDVVTQAEDPFDEAKKLHEQQMKNWKVLGKASAFTDDKIDAASESSAKAPAAKAVVPNPNVQTYESAKVTAAPPAQPVAPRNSEIKY